MSQDVDKRIDVIKEEINALLNKEESFRMLRLQKEEELVGLYDIY